MRCWPSSPGTSGPGKGQHVLAGVAQPWGPQGELSSDSVLGTWLLGGCPGLPVPHPYPIGGMEAAGCPQGWGRDPSPAAAATSQPCTHTVQLAARGAGAAVQGHICALMGSGCLG